MRVPGRARRRRRVAGYGYRDKLYAAVCVIRVPGSACTISTVRVLYCTVLYPGAGTVREYCTRVREYESTRDVVFLDVFVKQPTQMNSYQLYAVLAAWLGVASTGYGFASDN